MAKKNTNQGRNDFDVLEQDLSEKGYGLYWPGKQESASQIFSLPDARLVFCGEIGCDGGASIEGDLDALPADSTLDNRKCPEVTGDENLFIEGENLLALKLLLPALSQKVGVIYIDPPYNTGNDFGYSDNYRDRRKSKPASANKEQTASITESCEHVKAPSFAGFNSASEHLHSRWLSMIFPRLVLARQFLRDDGIICISIDDNEVDKLRLVMAEVFGEHNFLGQITVLSNPRGRQAEKHFATVHEYLLVFAKDASKTLLSGTALTEKQESEFRFSDVSGRRYRLLGLRQRGSASRQQDRPALHYPIYVDPLTLQVSVEPSEQFNAVSLPKKSNGAPGRWMWGKERVQARCDILEGKLIARRNEWDIFVRDFLSDNAGVMRTRKVTSVWAETEMNYQNGKRELKRLVGEAPVDYPKPVALIRKAINLLDDKDLIVLDFFGGTGTTAQAVIEANADDGGTRKFCVIQTAETLSDSKFATISDLCMHRIRSVFNDRCRPNRHSGTALESFKRFRVEG